MLSSNHHINSNIRILHQSRDTPVLQNLDVRIPGTCICVPIRRAKCSWILSALPFECRHSFRFCHGHQHSKHQLSANFVLGNEHLLRIRNGLFLFFRPIVSNNGIRFFSTLLLCANDLRPRQKNLCQKVCQCNELLSCLSTACLNLSM